MSFKYRNRITQERLLEFLHYDPKTGIFTWLKSTNKRIVVGRAAGAISLGYTLISIENCIYRAHRLAWLYVYGVWPNKDIDHINRIRSDNRIENLREATKFENARNIGKMSTNTSGLKGVTWDKDRNKWKSHARVNGKTFNLGRFDSKQDASKAYEKFVIENYGGFHSFD